MRRLRLPPSGRKYGNRKTTVNGIEFDSAAEARRYSELVILERVGDISGLRCQVPYPIIPAFRDNAGKHHRQTVYIADFVYQEGKRDVAEDVKGGPLTQVFALKEKLLRWSYPELIFRIVRKEK